MLNDVINVEPQGVPNILNEPSQSWGGGYALYQNSPDRINGKLYEIIEALGLSEKQELSIKSLVQKVIWDEFNDAVCLSPGTHSELRNKWYRDTASQPKSSI